MIRDKDSKEVAKPALREKVDGLLADLLRQAYESVDGINHLATAEEINPEYYKRHIIEIILRLRMKRWIDALTIHYFAKHNPVLAKKWANYTEDEMLHDRMFVTDLRQFGLSLEQVYEYEPMFSTKLLQGYFYYGLEHEGRPLASLCSSYYIEKMSLMTQPKWLENVEKRMGAGAAKGQLAHVHHDLEDSHEDFVWKVLETFVDDERDEQKIIGHFRNVHRLFCAFYTELYEQTIARGDGEAMQDHLVRAEVGARASSPPA
jgi:hypothetical protein